MSTVGIIGLGLIGGSLARDLSAAGWRVLGGDRDAAVVDAARRAGVADALDLSALHRPQSPGEPGEPGSPDPVHSLDLLILAVPVRATAEWLRRLAPLVPAESELVITDVGSTKETAAKAAAAVGLGSRFVGSHPVAGDHRSGFGASRTGLFHDAPVWLCPAPGAAPGAVDRVEALWRAVGARPQTIGPAEHDRRLACTSHLPQAVSTALAATLDRYGFAPHDLGPGGRDVTRLAGSDPDMWVDILLDNAPHVAPGLERAAAELLHVARLLRDGQEPPLRQLLMASRSWAARPDAAADPERADRAERSD